MKRNQKKITYVTLFLIFAIQVLGCSQINRKMETPVIQADDESGGKLEIKIPDTEKGSSTEDIQKQEDENPAGEQKEPDTADREEKQDSVSYETLSPSDFPPYSGSAYIEVNQNHPWFTEEDKKRIDAFETYSSLDSLGRCQAAYANICTELMPDEERETISHVKPSGWNNKRYDFIEGRYIYNRCHLIGFQLAGENANEKNLITGTRYLNIEGMLSYENMVADYVRETGNHVLYRITPVYDKENLVASGILMEAYSVEDSGAGICFNVYCYNVQPGCGINYADGDSWIQKENSTGKAENSNEIKYIANTSSMKFHLPDCSYAADISSHNRKETASGREDMLADGYSPCGKCHP